MFRKSTTLLVLFVSLTILSMLMGAYQPVCSYGGQIDPVVVCEESSKQISDANDYQNNIVGEWLREGGNVVHIFNQDSSYKIYRDLYIPEETIGTWSIQNGNRLIVSLDPEPGVATINYITDKYMELDWDGMSPTALYTRSICTVKE